MKKLNQIKLNQLSKAELSERELKMLIGGCDDGLCGCRNIKDYPYNAYANMEYGYHVKGGECELIIVEGENLDEVIIYGYQYQP